MAKLTGIIRALEKRQEALTKELRNVGAAIAALSGNGRRMNKAARKRIGRAVRRAWKKRKKLRA
jgi:hypothetical protein